MCMNLLHRPPVWRNLLDSASFLHKTKLTVFRPSVEVGLFAICCTVIASFTSAWLQTCNHVSAEVQHRQYYLILISITQTDVNAVLLLQLPPTSTHPSPRGISLCWFSHISCSCMCLLMRRNSVSRLSENSLRLKSLFRPVQLHKHLI